MYAYLKGILVDKEPENIVIEVHGIGYNVKVNTATSSMLPAVGSEVLLYTYTAVREDAIHLYGFISKDDLSIFKRLINVNGIGPKGGQSILSVMSSNELRLAIISGDAKAIAKAPGIGTKTASRVILDLKDKISVDESGLAIGFEMEQYHSISSGSLMEAVEALKALGYGAQEASRAVSSIEGAENLSVEDILKRALKFLI